MVQQFLPYLKTKEDAAILNVTSGLSFVPFPIAPIYGATKSGLYSYTKSLRIQLKNTNIKVFDLVAPGVKTPLNDKFKDDVEPKTLMNADKLVAVAIKGLEDDTFEIYPSLAKVIKIISILAPGFLLKQLSKPVEKMLNAKTVSYFDKCFVVSLANMLNSRATFRQHYPIVYLSPYLKKQNFA